MYCEVPGGAMTVSSHTMSGGAEIPWSRKWLLTLVFLPGEFRGAWQATVHGVAELDTPERLSFTHWD